MVYKWCLVPQCKNTIIRTPQKLFISVPKDSKRRKKWLKLAGRDPNSILTHSSVYMCEDHFNIEKDIVNYMKYKMGFSMKIFLSEEAVPFKFQCQENCKRRVHNSGHKRQRTKPVKKCAQSQNATEVNNESIPKGYHIKQEIIDPKDEAAPTNVHCQEDCKTLLSDAGSPQVFLKKQRIDSIEECLQSQNVAQQTEGHAESYLKDYTVKVEIIENRDEAAPTNVHCQGDCKTLVSDAGASQVLLKRQRIDSIAERPPSQNVIDAHAESFLKDYTIKVEIIEHEEFPESQDSMKLPLTTDSIITVEKSVQLRK